MINRLLKIKTNEKNNTIKKNIQDYKKVKINYS